MCHVLWYNIQFNVQDLQGSYFFISKLPNSKFLPVFINYINEGKIYNLREGNPMIQEIHISGESPVEISYTPMWP